MTKPKDRPILFNAEMVRAVLDGRKTQTRRPGKFVPLEPGFDLRAADVSVRTDSDGCFVLGSPDKKGQWTPRSKPLQPPYGVAGDTLYVREAFAEGPNPNGGTTVIYRASYDDDGVDVALSDGSIARVKVNSWTPSIHMPKWASRIRRKVTGVKVERLNDASIEDVWDEGYPGERREKLTWSVLIRGVVWFKSVWDPIYAANSEGWDDDPWVVATSFERTER